MRLLAKLSEGAAILAGWSVLFLAVLVTLEVLSRKLLSFSFQSADEIGGYVLAVASAGAFASALVSRSHTRVDLVWLRLPTSARAILNVLAYLAMTGFALFMVAQAWTALSQSYTLGSRSFTPLRTPLWVPQALWFAGLAFFALVAAGMTLATIFESLRDSEKANAKFGPVPSELPASEEGDDRAGTRDIGRETRP